MKKPTLKAMNNYCKSNKVEDITLLIAEDCELKVTPSLSLEERLLFIDRVSSFCINENGEELPEYFDVIFWTTVFQMMSNMPIPKIKDELGEESIDLVTMSAWIESLPADFMAKLRHANNEYIIDLEWKCNDKIDARAKYATSMAGTLHYSMSNADSLLNKAQIIDEVNKEMLAQTEATRKLTNIIALDRIDQNE